MIDLSKALEARQRQRAVVVHGIEYEVNTQFYWWISFENKFKGEPPRFGELDCLYKFAAPDDRQAGFIELEKFYLNAQPLPRPSGRRKISAVATDWLIDSEYIWAAFIQQYGIDLLKEDLHWHSFLALFNALIGTKLNEAIQWRFSADKKGPMKELREAWEIRLPAAKRPIPEMV